MEANRGFRDRITVFNLVFFSCFYRRNARLIRLTAVRPGNFKKVWAGLPFNGAFRQLIRGAALVLRGSSSRREWVGRVVGPSWFSGALA